MASPWDCHSCHLASRPVRAKLTDNVAVTAKDKRVQSQGTIATVTKTYVARCHTKDEVRDMAMTQGRPSTHGAGSTPIRVLLADDHDILRDGLRMLLEMANDIQVVGEARTGREAVAEAERLHPDVVLMD